MIIATEKKTGITTDYALAHERTSALLRQSLLYHRIEPLRKDTRHRITLRVTQTEDTLIIQLEQKREQANNQVNSPEKVSVSIITP